MGAATATKNERWVELFCYDKTVSYEVVKENIGDYLRIKTIQKGACASLRKPRYPKQSSNLNKNNNQNEKVTIKTNYIKI